jgi:hypothetical protein
VPELTVSCLSTVASHAAGIAPVQFHYPEREIALRELIALAVREQCALLMQRRAGAMAQAQTVLARQYRTEAEINAEAAGGAVNAATASALLRLDPEIEIARALRGFEAGAFLVLVGSLRCSGLDDMIALDLVQPVQFVRMVALTGG